MALGNGLVTAPKSIMSADYGRGVSRKDLLEGFT